MDEEFFVRSQLTMAEVAEELRNFGERGLLPATLFGRAGLPCRRVPCMRAVYEDRVERTAVHKGRARETAVRSSYSGAHSACGVESVTFCFTLINL